MNLQEEILKIKNEMIDEFDKRVEALKVDEQEFPQNGDLYWFIDDEGGMFSTFYENHYLDIYRQKIGNIFRSREQAEFVAEKLKVEAELRKFSRPFKNGEFNYYIFFYIDGDDIEVGYKRVCHSQGTTYFESEEKAKQAIQSIGEKRIKKYLFGVED